MQLNHDDGLSRRRFLRQFGLAGVALSGAPFTRVLWGEDPKPAPASGKPYYPSHAPEIFFKEDPQAVIDRMVMPRPEGKKLSDELFVSNRLENVFYLQLGRRAVLIDTGFDHQINHHLANFEQLGCDLSKIACILATHSHVDHTSGLKKARDRLGVPVVAHKHAIDPITKGDLLRTAAVIPEVKGWKFDYPACPIDETVDQGDVIRVGDERIDVLHIPGHTPDCLGYLCRGHFFTGDALFGAGLVGWASQQWFSNYRDHHDALLRLLADQVQAEKFHAAHGPELDYSSRIPEACLPLLKKLMANDGDPCNHTPRIARRAPGEATRELQLPD